MIQYSQITKGGNKVILSLNKKRLYIQMIYSLIQKINVLEGGLEPPQPLWPKDFKSFVSTIPPFEHPFKEERKTASEPSVRLCYSLKTLYFSKSEVVPVCYPNTDGYLPTLTVRLSCQICCKDIFVFRSYKIFFY